MSEFSERCMYYIHRSDTSVYRIAKYAGLDRTTLQRMVSGKRLPDISAVRSFVAYLSINIEEENQLLALYKMEKIGKEKFLLRKSILQLLVETQKYRKNFLNIDEFILTKDMTLIKTEAKVLNYEMDIYEAIDYMIQKEINLRHDATKIEMDYFPHNQYVMKQLIRIEQNSNNKIRCVHFINLPRNEKNGKKEISQVYINMLQEVLPFALAYGEKYEVRYSYVEGGSNDNYYRVWPHFLLTSSSLLLVSEDGKAAMLIENNEIINGYCHELNTFNHHYRTLMEFNELSYSEILGKQTSLLMGAKGITVTFANFNIRSFIQEEVKNEKSIKSTGLYYIEERLRFLRIINDLIKDTSVQIYTFTEGNNQENEFGNIALYSKQSLLFLTTLKDFSYYGVSIGEYTIVDIFADYFAGLNEDSNVRDMKESREVIAGEIQALIIELEKVKGEKHGD